MSQPSTKQYLSLYSVAGQPYLGMISSIDTAALAPGYWELGQNVRAHKVALEARYGASEFIPRTATNGVTTSTIHTSATYSGHKFTGSNRYLAILNTSSTISLYRYYSGAPAGWALSASPPTITPSSAFTWLETFTLPYPGTNISLLNLSSTYGYLALQTGGSSAYVGGTNDSGIPSNMALVRTLSRPQVATTKAVPDVLGYFAIGGMTTNNITSSTTNTTITSATLTGVGQYLSLNLTTGTAASQTTAFDSTTTAGSSLAFSTVTRASQLQLVFGGTDSTIWDRINVEVGNSTTWYYVHVNGITKPQIATVGDRYNAALFECSTVYTATATTTAGISMPTTSAITRMRFTYVGTTSPAAALTIPIYAATFASAVPFNTQFGQTFYQSSTASESPPTICENQPAPSLASVKGTPLAGVTLAMSPAAKYRYTIRWVNSEQYANYALTYVKQGETFYILDKSISAIAGSVDGTDYRTVDALAFGAWTMPSELCRPIPGGGPMALMGDRLFVAAQTSTIRSQIAFSEKGMPNRFAYAVDVVQGQVQPKSGGVADFGNETIWGITPTAGNLYGSDTGLVHTDRGVYAMQGVDALQLSRPSNVGPYGCISPWSIFRYRNSVGWITPERELRILGDDIGSLSARTIEDKLLGIPAAYLPNVTAAVSKDRLYIGYTPSGGTTNTQCLVYDARVNAFVSDDTLANSSTYTRLDTVLNSTDSALIGFHTNGWCYQYEVNTTGDQSMAATTTTESTVELRSRCLSDEFWNQIRIGDICITADDLGSGKTLTTTLTNRQTGATATGTINMNGSTSMVWRKGRGSAENARIGQTSVGVQLKLSGAMAPGKKIYSIGVESEKVSQVGYDVE